ncbi:MAG: UvrD-helicase domain-containing protein [Atopobiaceae bacterium]|nr:UvrD-helicase domain-containing protein [Atopobiaceae bacterium]
MDKTYEEEQRHLSEVYATICSLHDELTAELERHHATAAQDLKDLSDELRPDTAGIEADEAMETLAAIETLNAVIDAYNQRHDFALERLSRVLVLLRQPYFAKVRLKMRPGRPARDVYIGAVGLTDDDRTPLVVDWRSPVAETYYKQENGPTSFTVDGRVRNVELELRRQFDIERDVLRMYFDTTVAIEDSLLLNALKRHHSEKLQAITSTIQREQNEVVRHADVGALLVSGVAGSGKTSVMLQRVAYLFYQERKSLRPDQVYLFTPNAVFGRYIDSVLPSMGEANPQVFTWRTFVAAQGLGDRDDGAHASAQALRDLEAAVPELVADQQDMRDIRIGATTLLKAAQAKSAIDKFAQFPLGPRRLALTCDELHDRLERRLGQLSRNDEWQEEMLGLDVDEQVAVFGETVSPEDERETVELTRRYVAHRFAAAHDLIDNLAWLRIDRMGSRILGGRSLNATEWLWLRLLLTGEGVKNARYVMVDEVQDYSLAQLMLLSRFFGRAHFLLLGDEHQAIREGTATWDEMRAVFSASHGGVEECALRTSYRSSPEITELFSSLLGDEERGTLASVRRAGVAPTIVAFDDTDEYLARLRSIAQDEHDRVGLCAIVVADRRRAAWLSKKLGDCVTTIGRGDALPAAGVVLLDLSLAKGLEFDHVVVADAQDSVYGADDLSRRRLYTSLSRAMHEVTVLAQGTLTPLLTPYCQAMEERGAQTPDDGGSVA